MPFSDVTNFRAKSSEARRERLGTRLDVTQVTYEKIEKIGVARSHFGTHGDADDLFVEVIGK